MNDFIKMVLFLLIFVASCGYPRTESTHEVYQKVNDTHSVPTYEYDENTPLYGKNNPTVSNDNVNPDYYPNYNHSDDNPDYYPPKSRLDEEHYLYDGYYPDNIAPHPADNSYSYPSYDPSADNEYYPPAEGNKNFEKPLFNKPIFTN